MKQKAKRIEKQRSAVQQYQTFLEEVRNNDSDQYGSIATIMNRHATLNELQVKLKKELTKKEQLLNTMRTDFIKYENQMNTNTMQLNNTIANLKLQSEKIDDEKNRLKSVEQETSAQQFEKITQLSKILMAIDHLEGFCKYKKLNFDRKESIGGGLVYDAISLQNDGPLKAQFIEISQNGFDSYYDRTEYAKSQIFIIGQYLKDFEIVKRDVLEGKGEKNKGTKGKGKDGAGKTLAVVNEAELMDEVAKE